MMENTNDWTVEFFERENGSIPSLEFLYSLSPDDQVFVVKGFERLKAFGNTLSFPHTKPLGDGLFELRVRVKKLRYRFIYFYEKNKIIVVTHGFVKKSDSIPQSEIDQAKKYRSIYMKRKIKNEAI
jgi:phage-related protein